MEVPGIEPGTFRMRSGHSTTELHPHTWSTIHFTEHYFIFCKTFFNTEKQNQKRKILKVKKGNSVKSAIPKRPKWLWIDYIHCTILTNHQPIFQIGQRKSKSLNLSVDPEKNCTYVQSWFSLSFQQCTKSKWIRMWQKLQK